MKYVNQLEYPWIMYQTNREHPEDTRRDHGTFAMSGCGLASAIMVADRLLVDQPARYTGLAESAQDDEAEAVSLNIALQQELTEEEYRLFNEYYQEGQKVETISERAGTTPGAIRARLHRLKSKISKISFVVAVLFLFSQYM